LFHTIVELLSDLLPGMRHLAEIVATHSWSLANGLRRIARFSALPEIALVLLATLVAAVLCVGAVACLHWLVLRVLRPVTRVFVSYQHGREAAAQEVERSLRRASVDALRLPFLATVDHDALLDSVHDGIRKCDVLICLPGKSSSFVDAEVSMAFGMKKPMVFVLDATEGARLPNTAKKGYPLFSAEALRAEGYATLAAFVSYVTGDVSVALKPYAAALRHLGRTGALVLTVWACAIVAGSAVLSDSEMARLSFQLEALLDDVTGAFMLDGPLLWFFLLNLFLLTVPVLVYAMGQAWLRVRTRRAISRQRFRELSFPESVEAGLSRERLRSVLLGEDALAHHESAGTDEIVRGRRVPIRLQQGLLPALAMLAFGAIALVLAWVARDRLFVTSLLVVVGVLAATLSVFAMSRNLRRLVMDPAGFHFAELSLMRGIRNRTVAWSQVQEFEWRLEGKIQMLAWRLRAAESGRPGAETERVNGFSRFFGTERAELMHLFRAMHERYGSRGP